MYGSLFTDDLEQTINLRRKRAGISFIEWGPGANIYNNNKTERERERDRPGVNSTLKTTTRPRKGKEDDLVGSIICNRAKYSSKGEQTVLHETRR